ncbi:MAG TPA: biopolymer transporter ExbD [Syntrophales bacterium]|jgi:biopolymer transport protein TolR|nr:biopolymer transporter ExbD [Syntrophales bacterium]HPG71888.1 biopolymer transporter ExbD [Syntrophales bacterium]HPK19633.1 biopolymer transporter ExbD [Syntrophales bacterium]HQG83469.1 biopolymer transporter ExbD [Syntrophales bacterium]
MARFRRRNDNGNRPLAEINVTPLVDVVLVLLIIFMVTAPMLQMGIDVNLPRVKAKSINVSEEKLVLTINGRQEIYINEFKTTLPDLGAKLESIFKSRTDRELFMRADKEVPYGVVVQVMSEVRKAGIDKLGMITEPPRDAR